MNYSISQLANNYGLSRSTLLYYESIGLLLPFKRNPSNYRVYTDKESKELELICILRTTGVSLEDIRSIIKSSHYRTNAVLRERLKLINSEINKLREQQKSIIELLGEKGLMRSTRVVTKEQWIDLMRKAGLDDDGMNRWHHEFETSSPEAHQDFLDSLGLPVEEIALIRKRSRRSPGARK